MKLLDLFSGIGGFSLAASWVWQDELEIAGFCEIDKYAQKVLQKNFPGVPIHEDITKLDGKDFKNIDLLTGGFPCQDISVAGKGAGIEGSRSGLWFEMHRIIREVRPRFALIENVPMLTIRGGTRVIADLAEIGYDAEWQIVGADDVGAWHRRKRIWIVAYPNRDRTKWNESENGTGRRSEQSGENVPDTKQRNVQAGCKRQRKICKVGAGKRISSDVTSSREDIPNTNRTGNRTSRFGINKHRKTKTQRPECEISRPQFESSRHGEDVPDTNSKRRCSGDTRRQNAKDVGELRRSERFGYWDFEPNVGRVAHGIPNRVDRLKGLGNAIVPQVAALIMERIKNID